MYQLCLTPHAYISLAHSYTPDYTPSGRLCLSKHGETNSFTNPASVLDGVEEEDEDDGETYLWCEPTRTNSLANDHPSSAYMEYENRRLSSVGVSGPCLPSKLILVRHGQSEGNVDERLYTTKPDNAMRYVSSNLSVPWTLLSNSSLVQW